MSPPGPRRRKPPSFQRGRSPGDRDDDAPHPQGDRLQKILAAAGLGSRRACEELILTGRVEVDRKVVAELGTRVDPVKQEIRVDGEALPRPRPVYVMVHKPDGVVSTARDPSGRPRVTDLVPPELGRLFPVGRLDMHSEGLILLTNDGELAHHLTHPRYGIEKTYHVQVAGHIEPETLQQLERGIHLAEGVAKVVGASIKRHHKNSTLLEMVLDEGRNREIRRLLARVGHKVQRLTRVAIGPLKLGDLPSGAYRPLRGDEIEALRQHTRDNPLSGRGERRAPRERGSRKLLQRRKSGERPKFARAGGGKQTNSESAGGAAAEAKPFSGGPRGGSGGGKFSTAKPGGKFGSGKSRGGKFGQSRTGGAKPNAKGKPARPAAAARTVIGGEVESPPARQKSTSAGGNFKKRVRKGKPAFRRDRPGKGEER